MKTLFPIALGTGSLLLIPLLANWPWTAIDFGVAGILIFGASYAMTLAWRLGGKYRVSSSIALIILFLWLWAELAVGIFTRWGS